MARNNLLAYLDFSKECKIHTDAITFQSRAVISQKFKPIYFFIGKLTESHRSFTAKERGILGIV